MTDTYRLHGANPSPIRRRDAGADALSPAAFVWDNSGTARDVAIAGAAAASHPGAALSRRHLVDRLDSACLRARAAATQPRAASSLMIPVSPSLSDLIEDFGDEWVTKMMFHYRWYYADDRKFAQLWITSERMIGQPADKRQAAMTAFNDRQVGQHGAGRLPPKRTSPLSKRAISVCSTC